MAEDYDRLVGVGLIGAGRIGKVHARNLALHVRGARLSAIADVDLAAASACARELGVVTAVADYRTILDDPAIEAVAICSSTNTHAQIIVDAADAGKHVFCEKPIDLDLGRIDGALAAVDRGGVKLQVGFNRRFDPSFRRVRQSVASGEIGFPHFVRITSRDPAPPPIGYVRVSGGIFLDMAIHDFDMARFLVGRDIEEVYAVGAVLVDPAIGAAGDVDTAVITLRFDGGCLGSIDNSRRAVYGYDQRVEVFGSEGCASAGNGYPNTVVVSGSRNVSRDLPLNSFVERYADAYLAEMQAFVDCVLEDAPPPVTGQDGREPVVIGLAAGRSLREGRPVRLDEIG
jgi:myo-inositol 2-dehydrogenase/D-chiro-inositol 1-dehydrogenase